MNQNDTYKCIKSRTLKPECARPQSLATKNNKKIYGSLHTHSDLSILFVFDAIGILILAARARGGTAFGERAANTAISNWKCHSAFLLHRVP